MGVPFYYVECWLGIVSLDSVERCSVTVRFTLLKDVQMFIFTLLNHVQTPYFYSVEGCTNSCSILLCCKSTGDCFIFTLLKGVLWLSILLCWMDTTTFHFTLLNGELRGVPFYSVERCTNVYTLFLFFFTIETCTKTPFYSERCAKSCSIWLLKGVQRVVPLDFVEICTRGCILLCWKVR